MTNEEMAEVRPRLLAFAGEMLGGLVAGPVSNWGVDGCEVGGLAVVVGEVYYAGGVQGFFRGSDG